MLIMGETAKRSPAARARAGATVDGGHVREHVPLRERPAPPALRWDLRIGARDEVVPVVRTRRKHVCPAR